MKYLLPAIITLQVVLSFPYQHDTRYKQYQGYQYYIDNQGQSGYLYTGNPPPQQNSRFTWDTRTNQQSIELENNGFTIIIPTDNDD